MAEPMVIDSSVVAKWFLDDEDDVDLAENVLLAILAGDVEAHIPRVAIYEICHLLTKACQTHAKAGPSARIARDHAVECVRELFRLPLEKSDVNLEECLGALEMAVLHSKRHADMVFLWRAVQLNCQWCTADEKILAACRPTFPTPHVLLLSATR